MTTERYLMDVPLYWKKEEDFYKKYDADLQKHMNRLSPDPGYEWPKQTAMAIEHSFWESYVAPWRFNQIVGWIRIYTLGSQIRGEYWLVNAKRFSANLKKRQFSEKGKAFELWLRPEDESSQIFERLLSAVKAENRVGSRRVYPDTEGLENYGPFIDWHGLLFGNSA